MTRGRAKGPGRLWKRGKQWVLDYADAEGNRRRKALSTNKATAERLRQEIVHQRDMAIAGLGAEAGQDLPLGVILDHYLEDLIVRASRAHFKNVKQRLTAIVQELGDIRVRDLKPAAVLQIRAKAVADGSSNRTANLLVGRLKTMLAWAVENELIGRSPIAKLKPLPQTRDHQVCCRRALSEDEIDRFRNATEEDDHRAWLLAEERGYVRVPQLPWWTALLETGARYSEARLANWGDVDLVQRVLVLRAQNTKSKKERAIPLGAGLVAQLKALRVVHEQVLGRIPTIGDPVFLSPKGKPWKSYSTNAMRIFARLLERAGIPKVNQIGEKLDIHALRHTANTRWARAGVGIDHRQKLMGHSDPKLTAVTYSHLDVEDLRGAIEKMDERRGSPARRTTG